MENDSYMCDGCGESTPYSDIEWFTSSIGLCKECNKLLHKKVPNSILWFSYDEINAGDNEVAEFIIKQIQK